MFRGRRSISGRVQFGKVQFERVQSDEFCSEKVVFTVSGESFRMSSVSDEFSSGEFSPCPPEVHLKPTRLTLPSPADPHLKPPRPTLRSPGEAHPPEAHLKPTGPAFQNPS